MRPAGAWGVSRVLCWVAGVLAVIALGAHAGTHDPLGATTPFGDVGNKLVAPFARWDSTWYLLIADHGYAVERATVFYPLFPLAARVVGAPFASSLIGGVIVSMAGLLIALHLLDRLATLELGPATGRRTMLLLAFFPTAVYFSAVYTEGLYLALSIGAVYCARTGRWAWAGVLAGLSTLTRPTGIVLLVPLLLLYRYGPRGDRTAESAHGPFGFGRELAWLLAIPTAIGAYMLYLGLHFGDALAMQHQDKAWHRGFTFPLLTFARAAGRAWNGAVDVFHGHAPNNVYEFLFVCLALIAAAGALRRLPIAYGAYAAVGVIVLLCFPLSGENLAGFSRYVAPLFPLLMWLAAWASERRIYWGLLGVSALLMVVNAARFATWHFVA